jgi:serine/threonine-protein kinase
VRHPVVTTLALTGLLLLGAATAAAVSVAREQEGELRDEVLQANAFAARALSGAFLLELKTLADALERLAADPRVVAALDPGDALARERFRDLVVDKAFDTVFLLDPEGIGVVRVPEASAKLIGVSSRWRDYFIGAARLGAAGRQDVHVSRAYISLESGTARVSLSAPVFDASGRWRGVLQASVETAGVFGRLEARTTGGAARMVTLAGRADRKKEAASLEDHWLILLHRDVERGKVHQVRSPALAALTPSPEQQLVPADPVDRVDGDFEDPVPGFAGQWLAGVAPVGGTELAVIVQTHEQDAVAVNRRLGRRLLVTAGLAVLVGMGVLLTLAVALRRRDRPPGR